MEGEDLIINGLGETKIPFNGGEKVGFYFLETAFADGTEKWSAGESYAFGVQVRRLKGKRVVDSGQTVTNVTKFKVV